MLVQIARSEGNFKAKIALIQISYINIRYTNYLRRAMCKRVRPFLVTYSHQLKQNVHGGDHEGCWTGC